MPKPHLKIDLEQVPFKKLSEYGFFKGDIKDLNPIDEVLPYKLNSTLFSDYASKERFIYLPEGSRMKYNGDFEVLDFPMGTIIVKNFYFQNDARDKTLGRRIIETRLLVRKDKGWKPYEYKWNEEQTDAIRLVTGAVVSASTILENGEPKKVSAYVLPRELDCRTCHNLNGKMTPIGPKPASLHRLIDHALISQNQIDHWKAKGLLTGAPNSISTIPDYNDPSISALERGRAYLDANCGHCHREGGTANANGLYVNWDFKKNETHKGIYKIPTNFNAPNLQYDIIPGAPDQSILWYRMIQTEAPAMMPQIGRSIQHDEGIEIVRNYILNL